MIQDRDQRFSEAFRRWAQRPPATPPEQAAAQIGARLRKRRSWEPGAFSGLRLAAAALALGTLTAWWLLRAQPSSPSWDLAGIEARGPSLGELETPPLDDDVALFWLNEETPLYLTLSPPKPRKGNRS